MLCLNAVSDIHDFFGAVQVGSAARAAVDKARTIGKRKSDFMSGFL